MELTTCPECHGVNLEETAIERAIGSPPLGEVDGIDWVVETVWFKCFACGNTWTEYYEYADDRRQF